MQAFSGVGDVSRVRESRRYRHPAAEVVFPGSVCGSRRYKCPAAGMVLPGCGEGCGGGAGPCAQPAIDRRYGHTSGVRGGRSGALKNVQGHVVSRDTWCPRRAVRERRRPSQDSWPSWDSTVLGQRKCPGTTRGVLGQPTPSQDGDCPGHRVSRDTFASRTPFASQDIPPDPQMAIWSALTWLRTRASCG